MNPLNIPLHDNPTRQKIWRVVVFAAPLLAAAGISVVAFRAYFAVDTLSAFSPADTKLVVRAFKTPETSVVLEEKFHGTLLFPNAPFTMDELSLWSKRGSAVFLGENGIIGVAVSGKVPQATLDEAKTLGFVTAHRFGGTYIGTKEPSTGLGLRFPVSTMLPWYNGEAFMVNEHKGAPLRLTARSLTIHGFGRTGDGNTSATDQTLAKIVVSSEEAQNLLGFDVPLVYPGLRALENEMITHGFSFSLGNDADGTPYSVTVPEGNLTKEDMESMVSELYYTKSLALAPSADVYTSLDEIVSTSTAKPITTSDPSATITSITDNNGTIVRAAQTAHSLVLTNRPVDIQSSARQTSNKNACLGRANQWFAVSDLSDLLPVRLSTPGVTFVERLLESNEIAFTNHRTRVCW